MLNELATFLTWLMPWLITWLVASAHLSSALGHFSLVERLGKKIDVPAWGGNGRSSFFNPGIRRRCEVRGALEEF